MSALSEWIDNKVARYISGIMGLDTLTVIREPKSANPPKRGWHYVIVNMERMSPDLGHLLMPGELPETFVSIDEAMNEVVRLSIEYDHNVETARIFQLVSVDLEEMHQKFDEAFDTYLSQEAEDE